MWDPRCYIPNKLFSQADAAGSGTHDLRRNPVVPEEGGVGPGTLQHLEGGASKGNFQISQIKQNNVAHHNRSDTFREGNGHSSADQIR